MKFLKNYTYYLFEGRIEELSQKFSGKITDHEISYLKSLAQNSASNFEWLLKHYTQDKKNYEVNIAGVNILLDVLDDYFTRYLRIKSNLPLDKRDINSLKNTTELIEVINQYHDYDKMLDDKDLQVLFHNEEWIIFIPQTFLASKKWGWGRFCTVHDEDYFHYYNINNNSLVYVRHKFDYTKNLVIECFPGDRYQIWNYQDDNIFGDSRLVSQELSAIDDGFLDIDYIIDRLPSITIKDLRVHLAKLLFEKFNLEDINELLNSNLEEKNYEQILNHIQDVDLSELRSNIRDFI